MGEYIIKDCDVFEVLPGCLVNRTLPLRRQIEGFYSLVGKTVKTKVVSVEGGFRPDLSIPEEMQVLGKVIDEKVEKQRQDTLIYKEIAKRIADHIEKYHDGAVLDKKCEACDRWATVLYTHDEKEKKLPHKMCMKCLATFFIERNLKEENNEI